MPNHSNGDRLSTSQRANVYVVIERLSPIYALYYDGTNVDDLFSYIERLTNSDNIIEVKCLQTFIDENELSTVKLSIEWDNGEDCALFNPIIYPESFLVDTRYDPDQLFFVLSPEVFYRNYAEYDPDNKYNFGSSGR